MLLLLMFVISVFLSRCCDGASLGYSYELDDPDDGVKFRGGRGMKPEQPIQMKQLMMPIMKAVNMFQVIIIISLILVERFYKYF